MLFAIVIGCAIRARTLELVRFSDDFLLVRIKYSYEMDR